MGKLKKSQKFATRLAKMIKPTDSRIKESDRVIKKRKEDEQTLKIKEVPQTSSAMFLKYNSQLGPPFHVIVDTNFVNFSIKYRIDIMQGFMDCLYAKTIPYITDCVLGELEKLGQRCKVALKIIKDNRFKRLTCSHKGVYADDCIVQRVTQMSARNRRDLENRELAQLAESLPLASAITAQLDKASVIRLTSAYLSLRRIFPHFEDTNDELIEVGSFLLQTLDGFVLILDPDGKMMYVSETASVHLGLSQVELIGASIFDFLHRDDECELRYILSCVDSRRLNTIIPYTEEIERMFFVRLRCVLPKRNAGITYNGYKTISCWGYSKIYHDHLGSTNMGLIAVGYMLSRSGVTEMKLSPSMFMFRARLDLNIIFIDSRITALTGFAASSLLDLSLYHIVLLDDAHIIERAHQILLNKNQSTTGYYRMLHKGTGYVWVQSQFCIVPMLRASVSHCIVAITEVFSAREGDQTLALVQKSAANEPITPSTTLGEYSNLFYKGAPAVNPASQHSTPDT